MDHYVSFPALNWTLPIDPVLFSVNLFGFELTVRWYGFLIATGLVLALVYAYRRAKEFEINTDRMLDVIMICGVIAFLCARLYYVFFSADLNHYLQNPAKIFAIWEGGLAIYGGVIGAFVSALFVCPLRKVNTLRMFDMAAPGFLIGQAIGRWGNFFNQEAFGGNTTLPWGMTGDIIQKNPNNLAYDPTLPVHPTFLYESLWCLLGLLLIHIVSKKAYKFKGQLFCMYVMWYGAGRFFIEQLRTDSLMAGSMRISQFVALASVLGGAVAFFVLRSLQARKTMEAALAEGEPAEEQPTQEENTEEQDGEEN